MCWSVGSDTEKVLDHSLDRLLKVSQRAVRGEGANTRGSVRVLFTPYNNTAIGFVGKNTRGSTQRGIQRPPPLVKYGVLLYCKTATPSIFIPRFEFDCRRPTAVVAPLQLR